MLGDEAQALVLDRHLPTGKINDLTAEGDVNVE